MKTIELTQGQVALVDAEDFVWLNQYKWYALKNKRLNVKDVWYVRCSIPKNKKMYMHTLIMTPPNGLEVDHRNGNGLDNRRRNLRLCTQSQNLQNQWPRQGCSSSYKGVSWKKRGMYWRVYIGCPQIHLGCFDDEIKAAKRYDTEAKKLFGKFANLNFPRERYGQIHTESIER